WLDRRRAREVPPRPLAAGDGLLARSARRARGDDQRLQLRRRRHGHPDRPRSADRLEVPDPPRSLRAEGDRVADARGGAGATRRPRRGGAGSDLGKEEAPVPLRVSRSRIGVPPDGARPARSYVERETTTQERTMPSTLQQPRTNGRPEYSPPPPPPRRTQRKDDNSGYWAAFSLLLGMLVVVLGTVAVWMGFS